MSTPPSPAPIQPTAPPEGAPGAPQAGQPTPAEPVQTPPTPAPAPVPEPTPAPTEPADEPKGKAPKFDGEFDPKRFEKLVENLRGDVEAEKARRVAAEQKAADEQAAFMKKVAVAFGLDTGEDKPPTPEELAKQLADERGEKTKLAEAVRQRDVEFAVYRSAAQFGGDPGALLDSRSFTQAIAKLDPTSGTFQSDVEKAVKTAVDGNPKLAAKAPEPTPAPVPKGGAPMDGAPGGKRQLGAADVARMTPEQIAKAVEEGRLNSYLGSG